ncbi:MAG TPA: hypothetical protein VF498_19780, partial [Anaerolineales bacterium]
MKTKRFYVFSALVILAMVVTACGGGAATQTSAPAATEAATEAPAATTAPVATTAAPAAATTEAAATTAAPAATTEAAATTARPVASPAAPAERLTVADDVRPGDRVHLLRARHHTGGLVGGEVREGIGQGDGERVDERQSLVPCQGVPCAGTLALVVHRLCRRLDGLVADLAHRPSLSVVGG